MNLKMVKLKFKVLTMILITLFALPSLGGEIKSALDVMVFADSFTCNDKFPHHSFCNAVVFKPWTQDEKEIVSEYLRRINDPRLAHVLKTIQEKGITKIHRVEYGANWFNNAGQRRAEFSRSNDKALLWVNPVTNVIGFTDSFFKGTPFMDPYANVERKQLNVLHELFHVFDIATDHTSTGDAFKVATGWEWNGKEFVIHGVDYEKAKDDFKSILDLVKNKQSAIAYAKDRELGRTYGFPTVYAMMNSHECFAEVMSYYIFDPTAESYYSKDLLNFVNSVLQK